MSMQGNVSENWKEFQTSWDYYCIATELENKLKKPDGSDDAAGMKLVAATLCSIMGAECLKIMNSLPTLSTDDKKNPAKIISALRDYFVPKKNVLYERFKFNTAVQQGDLDEFVLRLRQLADTCEYGSLKDSLIRDRLVIGTSDQACRERLLRERPVPDLDKCIDLLRASEISRTHQQAIAGSSSVEHIEKHGGYKKRKPSGNQQKTSKPHSQSKNKPVQGSGCKWCGGNLHWKKECPAREETCHKCRKKGHFAKVCRGKTVMEISEEDQVVGDTEIDLVNVTFLGEIGDSDFWSAEITVNGKPTGFKLDSGSKVTVVSDTTDWLRGMRLTPTTRDFKGPGGVPLSHLFRGQIENATLVAGENTHTETVYVMRGQQRNLLSKTAIESLELLKPSALVYSVDVSSSPDFKSEFPGMFNTRLGKVDCSIGIGIKDNAVPKCLYTARKVAYPLLSGVKEQLTHMKNSEVISLVKQPTEWCSGMVCVPKKNGKLRICVDLTELNKAVRREIHPLATVEQNLAQLKEGKIFSKLDADSGFWQLPLDEPSRLLTTFITPYWRYCFNRLPFGISSAPEIFQRTMSEILDGLEGTICHMDDILIFGTTAKEHDERVRAVLRRLQKAGITLNSKCEFSKKKIKFLGHLVSEEGVEVDPEKVEAIRKFPAPKNITELQRFNGMTNQLAKFIPELASMNEPLRQLLRKDTQWNWDTPQEEAFQRIKEKLMSPEILTHYDPKKTCIIAADACQNGLGAVLLQVDDLGNRRPVAYASRSLTETEGRYAVIEKEALAATWACDKFSDYILGTEFTLETDHRPLVPLLSSTDLSKLPPRILRFRMRLMRYSPTVVYVQGIHQNTADALSRAPLPVTAEDVAFVEEVEEFVNSTMVSLPATEKRLLEIQIAQDADPVCAQVKQYCRNGWPGIMPHQPLLKPYWQQKQHLTVVKDILMFDSRLVIPPSLQLEVLDQLHQGHLGMTKCKGRAQISVWWPTISSQIESMVNKCSTCSPYRAVQKEPLIPLSFPNAPWDRLGTDLFELDKKNYVVIVDYASRWFEIKQLLHTTSKDVIKALREVFVIHGIPNEVVSDNGPQYSAREFAIFAQEWGFTHVTSSALHPQSNGEAERAVETAKNILKKNTDPCIGLLAYRTAPLQNGLSPAEILMGRRLRTTVPTTRESLAVKVDWNHLEQKENTYRDKYAKDYNKHYRVVALPSLDIGEKVYIRDMNRYGEITERSNNPRSYNIKSDTGACIRRNRNALVACGPPVPEAHPSPEPPPAPPESPGASGDQYSTPAPLVSTSPVGEKTPVTPTRAKRETRLPSKYRDYIM